MDLKTELSKESIFIEKSQSVITINNLNKKGIYTIEDFINNDVEKITKTPTTRKTYRAIQKILRYKYLGEPLVLDIILDKEYDAKTSKNQITNDLVTLGFYWCEKKYS